MKIIQAESLDFVFILFLKTKFMRLFSAYCARFSFYVISQGAIRMGRKEQMLLT